MHPAGTVKAEGPRDENVSKVTGCVDSRSLGFVNGLKHRRLAPGKSPPGLTDREETVSSAVTLAL